MIFQLVLLATLITVISSQRFSNYDPDGECCEDYCLTTDDDRRQVKQFSSKTSYEFVKEKQDEKYYSIPNCEPVKFWMLSRHGTRLPSVNEIRKFRDLDNLVSEIMRNYYDRKTKPDKGSLCEQDINLLKNWRWRNNITESEEQYLTLQGYQELQYNARHYQQAFPRLLNNIYTPEHYKFRYTDTERTNTSYRAFVAGLFGHNAADRISIPPIPVPDTLLKPYDQCSTWKNNDQDANNPNSEVAKFLKSSEFQKLIGDVSKRLGFKYSLDANQIETIWDMCRYEQAWSITNLSPWCIAFTPRQVTLLEYKEDLKYYYKAGYGRMLNSKIPCELFKDLITHFDSTANPKVAAYFSHSDLINTFVVALKAFKDDSPLRADNFDAMKNRKWQTSKIDPFAANIIAVKYNCPNQAQVDKMTMFINGRPINFNWCSVGLCDMAKFKENYKEFIENDCSKYYCDMSAGHSINMSISLLSVSIAALFFTKYVL